MRIDPLKTNLRHVVLLAKEYSEKINGLESQDASRIKLAIKENMPVNNYDRHFLSTVLEIKEGILTQIDYFSKKILENFAKSGQRILDIDTDKVEDARKKLTSKEFNLLGALYTLQVHRQHLERDKKGNYREVKIVEIEPAVDKFITIASSVSN